MATRQQRRRNRINRRASRMIQITLNHPIAPHNGCVEEALQLKTYEQPQAFSTLMCPAYRASWIDQGRNKVRRWHAVKLIQALLVCSCVVDSEPCPNRKWMDREGHMGAKADAVRDVMSNCFGQQRSTLEAFLRAVEKLDDRRVEHPVRLIFRNEINTILRMNLNYHAKSY